MPRRLLLVLLALAIATFAFPASSHAVTLHVTKDTEDGDVVSLVNFTTAKCRKGSRRAHLRLHIGAKKSGYKLSVNVWKNGRDLDLEFGGDSPADINIYGPGGSWSSLNKPPTGTAAGHLTFNRKKTRVGLGFSPMFDESFGSTIDVGGGLKCKYPRRRRR